MMLISFDPSTSTTIYLLPMTILSHELKIFLYVVFPASKKHFGSVS